MKPRAQLVEGVPLRMQAKTGLSRVLRAIAAGMEPAAAVAVKAGLQECGECPGARSKTGRRGKTHPAVVGKVKEGVQKAPGRKNGTVETRKR